MALFKFTKNILEKIPIDVYNHGQHTRDFTYIDDIVEGVIKILNQKASINPQWNGSEPDPSSSKAPWRIYNIGNNNPIKLMDYIKVLEKKGIYSMQSLVWSFGAASSLSAGAVRWISGSQPDFGSTLALAESRLIL